MSKITPPNTTAKPKAGAKSAQSRARSKNVKGKTAAKQESKRNRKLTAQQQVFVDEYIIDLNGTQAAIRAGYAESSARATASRLLTIDNIQDAIAEARKEQQKRTQITADRVLEELAKIGFADIRDVVSWGKTAMDDNGEPAHGLSLIGSDEITDNTAAAISEISEGPTGLKVKMHDKQAALLNIGRHLGMFKDKVEHSGGIAVDSTVRFVDPPARDD